MGGVQCGKWDLGKLYVYGKNNSLLLPVSAAILTKKSESPQLLIERTLPKWSGLKLDQAGFVLVFMHACLCSACWLHHSCTRAGCWNRGDARWRDWRAGSHTRRNWASKADLGVKHCVIVVCNCGEIHSWYLFFLAAYQINFYCEGPILQLLSMAELHPLPAKFNRAGARAMVQLHSNSDGNSFVVW